MRGETGQKVGKLKKKRPNVHPLCHGYGYGHSGSSHHHCHCPSTVQFEALSHRAEATSGAFPELQHFSTKTLLARAGGGISGLPWIPKKDGRAQCMALWLFDIFRSHAVRQYKCDVPVDF